MTVYVIIKHDLYEHYYDVVSVHSSYDSANDELDRLREEAGHNVDSWYNFSYDLYTRELKE